MPRHRMILSLDDEIHRVLKELSELTGTPASRLVVDLLHGTKPQFQGIIKTLRQAQENKMAAMDNLNALISRTIHDVSTMQVELLDDREKYSEKEKSKSKKKRIRKPRE